MNETLSRNGRPPGRSAARAVSLVEVCGATMCVAVLALWLMPALGSVRRGGKAGFCQNNLAQIAFATTIYAAQDPGDNALPVHPRQFNQCPGDPPGQLCTEPMYVGAYEWGGKSGVGRDHFVTGSAGDSLNSKFGSKAGFGPPKRPLNSILYGGSLPDAWTSGRFDRQQAIDDTQLDLDVFQCPSDTGYTGMHCPDFAQEGRSSYDHFGTSYNANIFMVWQQGGQLGPDFEPGEMGSNSPYLHRVSQVPNPSRILAYQENCGRFAWTASPEHPDCSWIGPGAAGTARGWHGKDWTFNAAFIDGHAGTIYMRGYHNELRTQHGTECIRIRGEGWQVDTLPAPFARTWQAHNGYGRPSYEDCISPGVNVATGKSDSSCVR